MTTVFSAYESDFVSLPLDEWEVAIDPAATSVVALQLEGGPYIATGANASQIRDMLFANLDLGTHPELIATLSGDYAVTLTASGPAQRISGGSEFDPSVTGPATLTHTVQGAGPAIMRLIEEVDALGLTVQLLAPKHRAGIRYAGYGAPRILEFHFDGDLEPADISALEGMVATFTNTPAALGYAAQMDISGLAPHFVDATHVSISPGSCSLVQGGRAVLSSTISVEVAGFAPDSWAFVHVLSDSTGLSPPTAVASPFPDFPAFPVGYDRSRRIASICVDDLGEVMPFGVVGSADSIEYVFSRDRTEPPFRVADSLASETFAEVELSAVVPPTASHWIGIATAETAVDVSLKPNGEDQPYGTQTVQGSTSAAVRLPNPDQKVRYRCASQGGSFTCDVVGYVEAR